MGNLYTGAEIVFKCLEDQKVDHIFGYPGGAVLPIYDELKNHPSIKHILVRHEQGAGHAAEGYARVKNKPAIVNVTTGPGSINSLNGVHGAFTDSIPMIIISGQVKRETMMSTYDNPGLRQLGDQEVDIISMVKGITKYAVEITNQSNDLIF